jgi:hypothetical protein
MNTTRVTPVGRPPGIIHCPACGAKLGRSDDPAVGYYTHCGICDVELSVRIKGPAILIGVK